MKRDREDKGKEGKRKTLIVEQRLHENELQNHRPTQGSS